MKEREEPGARPPKADEENLRFGRLAIRQKYATPDQVSECLAHLASKPVDAKGRALRLADLLIQRGLLTYDAVEELQQLLTPRIPGPSQTTPPTAVNFENVPEEYRQFITDTRRRFGRYILVKEVGRGGMGQVFKAWDTALERIVAVKFLTTDTDPEDVARFDREAKIAASLNHPHIAPTYEVGIAEGRHYIAMMFIEGRSMSDQKVGPGAVARMMRDVALAVDHAHKAGIVHRDLKPQNVMVDAKSHPYVMDFGIAKTMKGKHQHQLTQTGTVMGTPSYMAPEQAEGKSATPRSDVYSLGATMYHALTGRPPFEGNSPLDTIKRVVGDDVTPPTRIVRTVPQDLERIVLKAMEKNPQRRYATAKALAEDLDRFLQKKGVLARGPSAIDRMVRIAAKKRAAIAVAIAVVVTASIIYALGSAGRSNDVQVAAEQGDREFGAGHFDKALGFYNQAHGLDADDARINGRIADCQKKIDAIARAAKEKAEKDRLEAGRQKEEAEKQRLEAERMKEEADKQRLAAERQKAEAEEAKKRRAAAVAAFEKGKELVDQAERDLYRPAANLDDSRVKARDAILHLESALVADPAHVEALFYRARARLMLLDDIKAEADYTAAIAITPDYVPALVGRGKLWLRRWVDTFIDLGGANRIQGKAKERADKLVTKALADFEAAAKAGEEKKRASFEAMVLFAQQRMDDAVKACERALALNDTDEEIHKLLGDALMMGSPMDPYRRTNAAGAQRVEKAIESYARAIALRANYADARAMRAYGYSVIGRADLSKKDLDLAMKIDPKSFVSLLTQARELSNLHTPDANRQAEDLLRTALQVKPDSFAARVNLAVALCEGGTTSPQAERYLDEAIELNPDHPWGWYLKGSLIARDHRFEEAEPMMTKAIELEPATSTFWYNRGVIRANLGRRKEALADYKECLRLGHPEPDKVRQRIEELSQ